LFEAVVSARAVLGGQVAQLDSGKRLASPQLAADARSLQAIVDVLGACRPSADRPVGPPTAVIEAGRRLGERARVLRATGDPGVLRTRLRSLDEELDGVLRRSFPVVFGMPYADLVDRVLAERSAVAFASQASARGDLRGAALALQRASGVQRKIGAALRKQATRAGKAEKAA
jgi:hypothetical protein